MNADMIKRIAGIQFKGFERLGISISPERPRLEKNRLCRASRATKPISWAVTRMPSGSNPFRHFQDAPIRRRQSAEYSKVHNKFCKYLY